MTSAIKKFIEGNYFLPFIDETKTAEIMSTIVLFAQDGRIKEQFILRQIHSSVWS